MLHWDHLLLVLAVFLFPFITSGHFQKCSADVLTMTTAEPKVTSLSSSSNLGLRFPWSPSRGPPHTCIDWWMVIVVEARPFIVTFELQDEVRIPPLLWAVFRQFWLHLPFLKVPIQTICLLPKCCRERWSSRALSRPQETWAGSGL